MDFQVRIVNELERSPALNETFARAQLAAVSSILILRFHLFSSELIRFHGFLRVSRLRVGNELERGPAPKDSQLVAISLIFYGFHMFTENFKRFRGFPRVSRPGVVNEFKRSPASEETFARSQLVAISSIFVDFK